MIDAKVSLMCTSEFAPVQFEGLVDGNPFYFRARWGGWRFTVTKPLADPVSPESVDDVLYHHGETYGDGEFSASGMPTDEAIGFIRRCLQEFLAGERTHPGAER